MVRVVFFLTLLTPLVSEVSRAQEVVAFRSTTVIDVRTGEASPDTTVLVQDGTIAAIGKDRTLMFQMGHGWSTAPGLGSSPA